MTPSAHAPISASASAAFNRPSYSARPAMAPSSFCARLEHRLHVIDRCKPAGGNHRNGNRIRQRNRCVEVETLQHAIARNVGVDDRCNAGTSSKRRGDIESHQVPTIPPSPSTATLPSRASRPTATLLGNCDAASFTRAGSRTAAVPMMTRLHALVRASPRRSPCRGCRRRAAAGILVASRMRSTARPLTGLPAKAPSRSTICRYSKPAVLKRERLFRRIAVEDGRTRHVALFEAHGEAVLEIDGGEEDHGILANAPERPGINHGFHLRKFAISASPSFWLFSGWNWVPTILSRPTMAVTGPPYSACAIRSSSMGGPELIGMHEIGVQSVVADRNAVQQRMHARVAAACSSPYAGSSGSDRTGMNRGRPRRESSPSPSVTSHSRPRSAISCMPTQMPKNGLAALAHAVVQRIDHARHGIETAAAIGKGADARQHDAVGASRSLPDRQVRTIGLAAAVLPRAARSNAFARRVQIARARNRQCAVVIAAARAAERSRSASVEELRAIRDGRLSIGGRRQPRFGRRLGLPVDEEAALGVILVSRQSRPPTLVQPRLPASSAGASHLQGRREHASAMISQSGTPPAAHRPAAGDNGSAHRSQRTAPPPATSPVTQHPQHREAQSPKSKSHRARR